MASVTPRVVSCRIHYSVDLRKLRVGFVPANDVVVCCVNLVSGCDPVAVAYE